MDTHRIQHSASRRDLLKRTGALIGVAFLGPIAEACAPSITSRSAAEGGTGAESPVKGGHLTEGQLTSLADLSPIRGNAGSNILTTLYDSLLVLAPDGSLKPRLARALPNVSSDGLTYTFELRNDVKWTDGMPLTADDVAFTYKLMYHPDYKDTFSAYRSELEALIADVTAPDAKTLVIKTQKVSAPFLVTHTGYLILPKHVLGEVAPAALNTHDFLRQPKVTSGSFKLREFIPGDHITVDRNDSYFLGAPHLDSYIMKFADQNSLITQLKTGEVDLYNANVWSRFDELKGTANLDVDFVDQSVSNARLHFNLDPSSAVGGIFASKSVRQALMYAVDQQGIMNSVIFGYGVLPSSTGVFPPTSWANNPGPKTRYTFDKNKAQDLLDADGWRRGASGIREKNGVTLKFELGTSGESPEWKEMASIVQQNWTEIGADVTIFAPAYAQLRTNALQHKFDVLMHPNQSAGNVDPDPSIWLHSRNATVGGRNFSAFKDAEVDRLLDEGASTLDQAKRNEVYFALQDIVNDSVPSIQLPWSKQAWARNKRVRNVGTASVGPFTLFTRYFMNEVWVADGK